MPAHTYLRALNCSGLQWTHPCPRHGPSALSGCSLLAPGLALSAAFLHLLSIVRMPALHALPGVCSVCMATLDVCSSSAPPTEWRSSWVAGLGLQDQLKGYTVSKLYRVGLCSSALPQQWNSTAVCCQLCLVHTCKGNKKSVGVCLPGGQSVGAT